MFGLLVVFTANLSLIFIDHLHVDPAYFGFYQASVMTTFFVASLLAAGCIGKFGSSTTKKIGNACFGGGVIYALFAQANHPSPLALTIAMSLASAGVAIACVIYFIDSLSDFPEAKGAANALAQALRLVVGAGMIGLASTLFNGSMKPIALMGIVNVLLIVAITIGLLKKKCN